MGRLACTSQIIAQHACPWIAIMFVQFPRVTYIITLLTLMCGTGPSLQISYCTEYVMYMGMMRGFVNRLTTTF